ncbi:hypothetical protein niasHT_006514 [Heterodera trifolii]|uniref:Uncharacterized protein n=1 Tax=Heterodera trifolii TaxID=157864 RepID=A0ABD2LTW6_9BILA
MTTTVIAACLLFLFIHTVTLATAGPVNVRIETENNQDFHIGPEPRTRFDLVEAYRPLARAMNTHHARAFASSLSKPRQAIHRPQPVHLLVDIGEMSSTNSNNNGGAVQQQQQNNGRESAGGAIKQRDGAAKEPTAQLQQQQQQKIITKSQWLDWTRWSRCENGERIRVRKCLSINGGPCEGPSIEKQSCFSSISSGIKFAKDPSIIEREIRGDILTSQRRFALAKN